MAGTELTHEGNAVFARVEIDPHRLERDCDDCRGSGVLEVMDCPACDGKGFILTAEGRQLVAFMARWMPRPTA